MSRPAIVMEGTPLHWAGRLNHEPEVIRVLLDNGADIEASDNVGMRPLHLAAENNQSPQVISMLLTQHANIAAQDAFGQTPLVLAEASNTEPSVAQLLRSWEAGQQLGKEPLK